MRILYYNREDNSYHATEIMDIGYSSDVYDVEGEGLLESPQEGLYIFTTDGDEIVFLNIRKHICNDYIKDIYNTGKLDLTPYDYDFLDYDDEEESDDYYY